MGAEIDRLEIAIESKATKVNNSLDTLVTKLDKVSGALSHLNRGGLSNLSDGVAKFSQASAQLSNVKTSDFTRLAKNIEKLSNLNSQQLYGASHAMRTLANSMNSFGNIAGNSAGVAEFASSIGKLGGANVQRAITNLPALATAMKNVMATMAKAPQVSNNVIQMTRALADLASQDAKAGTAGNSLTTSINRIGTSMEKTTKKARSFSSVIGSIYQKCFWVTRAGNKLWDSVKSSMDYVEVLNYFDAAFGQVADSAVSQWEEAGADSAQAYYNSFSERAKQLTTKMTGFTVADSGMLESTGGKSLGINPSTLMNYQAMFAQMSNSMGVTAETSLKLSTALTEIGADLASVKNMDFDKVWTDMASGLVGMSRTLDKYGANIRNVNLQQKLTELGINANITALNQNEKALLRTIILLDSTRYAWSDLCKTIDKPANQLRLLQANFGNLARTIGNIFLPIVAKVLPYLNAFVIALQRLAEWIVKLLGFEDFDWGGSSGTGGTGFDDLLGSIEDTEDGLNDATKAAKKLSTQLFGIDELNILNSDDDSSGDALSGLGGYGGLLEGALDSILDEYQKAWDEAFANMEERYNQFADNVANAFAENGLYGVGEYFSMELTKALNSIPWENIYEGAKGFGSGLANFLNGLISPELFGAVGMTIASSLNTAIYAALSFGKEFDFYDFGSSIAAGINEFFDTFDFGALADTLNTWVDGLKETISGFVDAITWDSILEGAVNFLGTLELDTVAVLIGGFYLKNTASNMLEMLQTAVVAKFTYATNPINIPSLLISFGKLILTSPGAIGELGIALGDLLNHSFLDPREWDNWFGELYTTVYNGINNFIDTVIGPAILSVFDAIGQILVDTFNWDATLSLFESAKESFKEGGVNIVLGVVEGILGAVGLIVEPIGDFFVGLWNAFCDTFGIHSPAEEMKPLGEFIFLGIVEGFESRISEFADSAKKILDNIKDTLLTIKKNISESWNTIKTNTTEFLTNIGSNIREKWESIKTDIAEKVENIFSKISEVWENIKRNTIDFLTELRNKIQTTWENIKNKITEVLNNIKTTVSTVWNNIKTTITNVVKNIYDSVSEKFEAIKTAVKNAMDKAASAINSFKDAISNAISKVKDFFDWSDKEFKISLPTDIFDGFIDKVSSAVSKLKDLFDFDGKSVNVSSNVSGGSSVRGYATGGYPSSASLFWAGENGVPEILGTVGGRTAVAGGAEITGIRDAVYSTGQAETALLQTAVNLLQIIADKDPSINIDGRDLVDAYDSRKARNGYAF